MPKFVRRCQNRLRGLGLLFKFRGDGILCLMLDEMLAGNTLVYRANRPNAQFGLPTGHEQRVGQWTSEGLRPIPLDATLRQSVEQCRATITAK